jgi:hypothetical protein
MCAKRSTSNAPPLQPNPARARSVGRDCPEQGIEVSSCSHTRHLSKDGVSYQWNKRRQNRHKGKDHHPHDARNFIEENHPNIDLAPDHQSTCETQTTSWKQSYLAHIERGQGGWGVASFGELTTISDAKQIDEVVVVSPSPHQRCHYPMLPSNR